MRNKMKNIIKNNVIIYEIYKNVFTFIFNVMKIFIKIDEKVILFNSYGGKKYDDSPKVIFEYMISIEKYKTHKIYWAFENPEEFNIVGAEKIKSDTLKYFIIALKAQYWITNSSIERGLKFKNKKTVYINTWHGTPIKKMGKDIISNSIQYISSDYDIFYAQSTYDIEVFSKAFNINKNKFALVGLPRNDELKNVDEKEIINIKLKLNIPSDKKIILYAPTFREYERDSNGCVIAPPINLDKWKQELSNKYIILFRAHYEINTILNIKSDNFIINASNYNNLNELLKISDILISDYSSIMFDYSILNRPIFSYAYDYEKYIQKRGMYIDISKELPNGIYKTEEEILDSIKNIDFNLQKEKTMKFSLKYIEKFGEARKYIENII